MNMKTSFVTRLLLPLFVFALASPGHADTPVAWGYNYFGELDDGTTTHRASPVLMTMSGALAGKTVVKFEASFRHTMALTTEGRLYGWGWNFNSNIGDGTSTQRLNPVATDTSGVLAGKTITDFSCSGAGAMALSSDSIVYAWGNGPVGDGTFNSRESPVAIDVSGVLAGKTITAISAGNEFSLVLSSEGKVYSWGRNDASVLMNMPTTTVGGQLGAGAATSISETEVSPVAVDMTGVLAGKTVTAISAGAYHSLVLTTEGKVYSWGVGRNGALGHGVTQDAAISPVAVDMTGALAGKTVTKVLAAGLCSFAITSDGLLYAWGINNEGQLGDGTTTDRLTPVAVNLSVLEGRRVMKVCSDGIAALVLTQDGRVFGWGANSYGELGNGTTTDSLIPVPVDRSGALSGKAITYLSFGDGHAAALAAPDPAADVKVYEGVGTAGPQIFENTGIHDFGSHLPPSAFSRSFTLKNDGVAFINTLSLSVSGPHAGNFAVSPLSSPLAPGASTTFNVTFAPTAVGFRSATITINGINVGDGNPIAFRINVTGTGVEPAPADAYGYGVNTFGEVGDGSTITRPATVRVDKSGVLAGKFFAAISAGSFHKVALSTEGKVYAWGANDVGQLGIGTQIDSPLPVAVTGVLATKTVTAIAAGAKHCLALTSEGKVYAWGDSGQGQLGINSYVFQTTPVPVDTTGVLAGKTVVGIAAGENNSFAVTSDGLVFAWGYNNSNYAGVPGKLGDGTSTAFRPAPVAVTGALTGKLVTMVSVGDNHTLAVTADGKLFAWGENTTGALGDGTTTHRLAPVAVDVTGVLAGKTIISASAGYDHTLAVSSDGQVFAWGANGTGQLGDGTMASHLTPVAVDMSGAMAGKNVISVCAANSESIAVTSSGEYFGWGYFAEGQAGGSIFNRLRPVAGDKTGLLQGKTVVTVDRGADSFAFLAYGATPTEADIAVEQPPATNLLSSAVRSFGNVPVSTGAPLTFTVKNVGTATMTGIAASITGTHDTQFSVTSAPAASVLAGDSTTVTITFSPDSAGTKNAVLHLASNDPQENPFDIILTGNGGPPSGEELYGWGRNDYGQVGDSTTANRSTAVAIDKSGVMWGKTISAVEGGNGFTLALSTDGRMYSWGANVYGELGNSTNAFSVSPVAVDVHRALLGETVTAISAGGSTSAALTASGKVYAWGDGGQGQRGDGTFSPAQTPWPVDTSGVLNGKTITKISVGGNHMLARSSEGKVYAWGLNNSGQLGNGSGTAQFPTPSAVDMTGVLSGKTVTAVSAGSDFSLALTSEGKVYAWGSNYSGTLGNGTTTDSNVPVAVNMSGVLAGKTVIAISAGYGHALALTDEGKVYGWGSGGGAIGDGTTDMRASPVAVVTSGALAGKYVIAIKASQFHSLALTADGKVYAWGYNPGGLGNGMIITNAPVDVSDSGALFGKTALGIACGTEHTLAITGSIFPGEIAVFDGVGTGGTERADNAGSVTFPGTVASSTSTAQSFTIKNNGGGFLTDMSASFSGTHPADFTISSVPGGLAPGATATVTVNFTPTAFGTRTAVLNIGSSDANENPFRIIVTGTGLKAPRLYGWGWNAFGQVGSGDTQAIKPLTPVKSDGALAGKTVTAIGRPGSATLCLDSEGKVYGWGMSLSGRATPGDTDTTTDEPLLINSGALAGKVVTQASNGGGFSLVLASDGKLYSWGDNELGQLGDGSTVRRPAPVAVDMTGVLAGKTIIAISAGGSHVAVLTSEGRVYSWGDNTVGQLGAGSPNFWEVMPVAVDMSGVLAGKTIVAISAGSGFTMALASDGRAYGWGRNIQGELGTGTAGAPINVPVAVTTSGVLAGKTIVKIAARNHTLALTSDGGLFAWGARQSGALGNGTDNPAGEPSPVAVDMTGVLAGKTVMDIGAGYRSSYALTSDGKVFAWGFNEAGQLNDGTTTNRTTPVATIMTGFDAISFISAGDSHVIVFAHPSPTPEISVFDGVGTGGAARTDNTGTATFTSTSVGSTQDMIFTIQNTGEAPLTGLALSITGAHPGDYSTSTLAGSTLDPGDTDFVTVTVTFAPTATGTRTATVQIASIDANENPFRIQVSGSGLHSLASWRATHFPGSTSSTGPGADTATPQNDGIPNLMKFALGMDPTQPGTLPITVDAGGEFLSYTYTPSVEAVATGIQFRVEFSNDLSEFSWSWEIVNQGVIGSGGIPVTATAPKPESGEGFMRLTVTTP